MSIEKRIFGYKRCVVLFNPASTNSARGRRFTKELAAFFPPEQLEVIESPKN
jgi:hypothetical protein